jgi:hypothetical protein
VEDQGAALFNPLQRSGVFDDDGPARRKRNRADNRRGNREQQRTRRDNHHRCQESLRLALNNAAAAAPPKAIGVSHAPSWSPIRRNCGFCCSVSCITFMIRAYRESSASFSTRITKAFSPLTAPEIASEPGVFEISYGSPVR